MNLPRRLAELAVVLGANVQPDQVVRVACDIAHVELAREVADAAYRQGACFVDVDFADPYVHRSRLMHARAETLGYVPVWPNARIRELDAVGGANIKIAGPVTPGLYDDLDPVRVNRAQRPLSRAWREVEYRVNNTVIPGPTEAWARSLRPHLSPGEALESLWSDMAVACRLVEGDPVAAWRERFDQLGECARALTALRLDAVRLQGPGTDLLIGLPPTARWEPPTHLNTRGVEHAWNVPSEEVYTVPDRHRVDGQVRLTSPAVVAGRLVDDVTLSFRGGRVVTVSGSGGVEALRAYIARDKGTARLGELALVDGASAVGSLGRMFGLILLDENRASHVALGFGFAALVEPSDRHRVNESGDHLDVTVGSDRIEAIGIDASGREHPLLRDGEWQLSV